MLTCIKAWDREYAGRGRLWGGKVVGMPALPEGSNVLELGCGDGKTLAGMPDGWLSYALDFSLPALRLSRSLSTAARLILADACRLPFLDSVFDAVFAFHVTGHLLLPGRRALAAEAARVLVPGGRLFFREFAAGDIRDGKGEQVEAGTSLRRNGIATHFFRYGEAEELFCDLRPVSVEECRWSMRIRGTDLMRCEVQAVFEASLDLRS